MTALWLLGAALAAESPTAGSLSEEVLREAAEARDLLGGGALLVVLLVVVLAWLTWVGGLRLLKALRRAGYDEGHHLGRVSMVLAVTLLLLGTDVVLRQVLFRAPVLGVTLLVVVLGGLLVGLADQLRRSAAGAVLVVRGEIKPGDRLTAGGETGVVERTGLLRLRLRRPDGAHVYLPTSALSDRSVTISSPRRAQPVVARLAFARPVTREERRALQRVASLCPYRHPDTAPDIELEDWPSPVVTIRLQAWSEAAAAEAAAWLEHTLPRALSPDRSAPGG